MTEPSTVLARGFQDLSREWLSLVQERVEKNLDVFSALVRRQSVSEFIAVQSKVVRDSLEQSIEATRRVAAVSTRVASDASQTITAHARGTARRAA
jgi:phasin family protein